MWLDSSFSDRFDLFLLHWDELGLELSLSTKGFHPISHEFIDRGESSSWSSFWALFVPLRFPVDWLQIEWWSLRDSSPTALWSCVPSLVAVGVDLVTNRVNLCSWRFSGELIRDSRTVHGSSPDIRPSGWVLARLCPHCV
jgi:hypothetical protein